MDKNTNQRTEKMQVERTISKGRLEAITDGIIAIAATIMVLELHTPASNDWAGLLEERTTLLAYIISFFMIYIVWRMHHDLFNLAEVISRRAFLCNGIWLFFLTLVPFTTGWVGSAPNANVPALLYPLNLLLWSLSFHLMYLQIRRDNPGIKTIKSAVAWNRIIMYAGYGISIILSFFAPVWSMRIIGIVTVVIVVRLFASRRADLEI